MQAASPIADLEGLRGRCLIAVAGLSNLPSATDLDVNRHLGLTIVPARDMPEAFRMPASSEGHAMIGSDVLIRPLVPGFGHPADYSTLEEGLAARAYGILVRPGSSALRTAAGRALHDVIGAGEFGRIHERWFLSPQGPAGVRLDLSTSAQMRQELDIAQP